MVEHTVTVHAGGAVSLLGDTAFKIYCDRGKVPGYGRGEYAVHACRLLLSDACGNFCIHV